MPDSDALMRAKACLSAKQLAKAESARSRHQRRQARLQRLAAEREQQRHALQHDPVTRALAKANATASRSGGDGA